MTGHATTPPPTPPSVDEPAALAYRRRNLLLLRHTPRDADLQIRLGILQLPKPAQLGIDLLSRLLADVACVQQHQIGVFHRVGGRIAIGFQRVAHTRGIVDVHLAAPGLDEDLFVGGLVG